MFFTCTKQPNWETNRETNTLTMVPTESNPTLNYHQTAHFSDNWKDRIADLVTQSEEFHLASCYKQHVLHKDALLQPPVLWIAFKLCKSTINSIEWRAELAGIISFIRAFPEIGWNCQGINCTLKKAVKSLALLNEFCSWSAQWIAMGFPCVIAPFRDDNICLKTAGMMLVFLTVVGIAASPIAIGLDCLMIVLSLGLCR